MSGTSRRKPYLELCCAGCAVPGGGGDKSSFYAIFVGRLQYPEPKMRNLKFILFFLGWAAVPAASAQPAAIISERPALVVNIVVGGLPYDFMERFGHNFSENGFRRFAREGMVFTEGRYDYMPTNSVSSLATITTGAYPSVHGVVGPLWYDVLTGREISLIADPSSQGLECEYGEGCFSNLNLTAPTLGDRLKYEYPGSRVISIAADPASAIVMAGLGTEAYWVNPSTASWTSSSKYMLYLPGWVIKFNEQYKKNTYFNDWLWRLQKERGCYVNRRSGGRAMADEVGFRKMKQLPSLPCVASAGRYAPVYATPLASDLVADFVRQAVVQEKLGADSEPDLLNVCFDAPRDIIAHYGPESVEAEDMLYHLDATLSGLIDFIRATVPGQVLFVLTSDHGCSASFDLSEPAAERFSGQQFRTIINSFLCAQYGGEDWVSGYFNRRIYINRSEAFSRTLPLDGVQRLAADFALQFRGISRVVPACELRSGSAGDRYMQRLRNGYYPKRSGDLLVDLVPGLIEERRGERAAAGSAYDNDVHVPLMLMGCGIPNMVVEEDMDMASLPVMLARILGIQRPEAATAEPVKPLAVQVAR